MASSTQARWSCSSQPGAGSAFPALWLLGLGIVATLVANVMHGFSHGPVGAVVAAWPAVALVGSYELLMSLIRANGLAPDLEPGEVDVPEVVPAADPLQVQAADAFADQLTRGHVPTIRALRSALRIGQPRAQQIQTYLAALARTSDVAVRSGVR